YLPFDFGWQTLSIPLCKRGGFVIADVANRTRGIDRPSEIHRARRPAIAIPGPVLGRFRAGLGQPTATRLGPELFALVSSVRHEFQVATIGNGIAFDQEWAGIDLVTGPLVVVGGASVVGSDGDSAAVERDHLRPTWLTVGECTRPRGVIGLALLELQGLENRLVVLILVLENHGIDVCIAQE